MFLFALKMCVADLKRVLHRFWWIAILFMLLIVIAPFHEMDNMYAVTYIIYMSIALMVPRYSRIHFVVPLDEKQMKKFFLWRIVIVGGMMLLMSFVFSVICLWLELPWNPSGLYWIFSYLTLYMIVAELGLQGVGIPKDFKNGARQVIAMILGMACWFMGVIVMDYFSVKWALAVAIVMLLVSIAYMLWYVNKIQMEDYTYVPLGAWENGKRERD